MYRAAFHMHTAKIDVQAADNRHLEIKSLRTKSSGCIVRKPNACIYHSEFLGDPSVLLKRTMVRKQIKIRNAYLENAAEAVLAFIHGIVCTVWPMPILRSERE